jgi:hypothetical protein
MNEHSMVKRSNMCRRKAMLYRVGFTRSVWRSSDLGRPAYFLHMLIN